MGHTNGTQESEQIQAQPQAHVHAQEKSSTQDAVVVQKEMSTERMSMAF